MTIILDTLQSAGQNIRVTSWTGSGVDTNYTDGRSYLLAEVGGRMDIIGSEVSHLGWSSGEPSGLAWRERGTATNPETGATGSILNSDIHDNYFGQYSFEAYGLIAKYNEFHHNVVYGFDPHDESLHFEVAYNQVYSNGKHGIIFSSGCTNNWIHDNEVHDNAEHGIMLDRGSNHNTISGNLVYGICIVPSAGRSSLLRSLLYPASCSRAPARELGQRIHLIGIHVTGDVNDVAFGKRICFEKGFAGGITCSDFARRSKKATDGFGLLFSIRKIAESAFALDSPQGTRPSPLPCMTGIRLSHAERISQSVLQ